MILFEGVTDLNWYLQLREQKPDEVNFWTPGGKPLRKMEENDLFLFKLKAPENAIAGGGFFVRFVQLPVYLAWAAFGEKNGRKSQGELREAIDSYRQKNGIPENGDIGCTILTEPFWFPEEDWIPTPDWPGNLVRGKGVPLSSPEGRRLYDQVLERIPRAISSRGTSIQDPERYTEVTTRHRLGQGGFRALVTEAYDRRCAITGDKTLPVLEAAHIRPYANEGPHLVTNGLLLRSDFHTLFDMGYLTVSDDLHIEVSRHLREDTGNGAEYYHYQGAQIHLADAANRPDPMFLQWHQDHVYQG